MSCSEHLNHHLENGVIEEMGSRKKYDIAAKDVATYVEFVRQIYNLWKEKPTSTFNHLMRQVVKRLKVQAKKTQARNIYLEHFKEIHPDQKEPDADFVEFLLTKPSRGQSGVETVTILTSPYPVYQKWNSKTNNYEKVEQRFSCRHDCHYCPKETAKITDPSTGQEHVIEVMPRSYLTDEPACRRAAANKFDCFEQVFSRLEAIRVCGHPTDKIEMIWLGGTLTEYPKEYITEFARDMYYACNCFPIRNARKRLSLKEEMFINITAKCRVIGLTIETRPDAFSSKSSDSHDMAVYLRSIGTTRIQMGVQHTDDYILKKINRGCYLMDTVEAIRLLKNLGFKTIIHLMPDLPFSSPEKDKDMLSRVLTDPGLQSDEIKIYPTATTQHTTILKWNQAGKYIPYAEKNLETLIDVILYFKRRVPRWIRLPRVVRDIPDGYIEAGIQCGNLRQVLAERMKKEGSSCQCIRCREIKGNYVPPHQQIWDIHVYRSSGGTEYFISKSSQDQKHILGFVRLRLSKMSGKGLQGQVIVPELVDSAMIRELHVYGRTRSKTRDVSLPTNKKLNGIQHRGLGMELVQKAKDIAWAHGYQKIAVTSGIGVRSYYLDKCGFTIRSNEMYPNQPLYMSWGGIRERCYLKWDQHDPLFMGYLMVIISVFVMLYVVYPT